MHVLLWKTYVFCKKVGPRWQVGQAGRNIPNYTFTDREKDIIEDVAKQVQNNCSEFLNGKISSRDIEQLAGYLMFGQYNPKLLHRLLDEDFFNFIMLLGEYTHYFE